MSEQKKISLRVLDGQTEFAEDEIQKLGEILNKLSKPLFYLALVLAVGFFGVRFYTDANVAKQKAGAEQLAIVQTTYDEFQKAVVTLQQSSAEEKQQHEKTLKDVDVKLKEQLKTLGDKAPPYNRIAQLYTALMQASADQADAKTIEVRTMVKELLTQ
jgi:hypothetical protein